MTIDDAWEEVFSGEPPFDDGDKWWQLVEGRLVDGSEDDDEQEDGSVDEEWSAV